MNRYLRYLHVASGNFVEGGRKFSLLDSFRTNDTFKVGLSDSVYFWLHDFTVDDLSRFSSLFGDYGFLIYRNIYTYGECYDIVSKSITKNDIILLAQ